MTSGPPSTQPIWWRVHDVVVGLLSGFGVGAIAGLFLIRIVGTNVVVPILGGIVAVLGVLVLIQNHKGSTRFINAVVVTSWVLLVLSAIFIAMLIFAVATFE